MPARAEIDEWGLVVLFYAFSIAQVWEQPGLTSHSNNRSWFLFGCFFKLTINNKYTEKNG